MVSNQTHIYAHFYISHLSPVIGFKQFAISALESIFCFYVCHPISPLTVC